LNDADILISAVGNRPKFIITKDLVKFGSIVIDVGVCKVEGKLCGDVDFEEVKNVASYITPSPGGVGPMTVMMLVYNSFLATSFQFNIKMPVDPMKILLEK
jgi:methylenetetrahydrofolate dehydrogenase (NADP+)/methenyltetrahydrofolate cyclohydrolase